MRPAISRARLHYLAVLGLSCGGTESAGIPGGLVVAPTLASGAISKPPAPPDGGARIASQIPLPPEPKPPANQYGCQSSVACYPEQEDTPPLAFPAPYERCLPSVTKSGTGFSVQATSSRRQWDPRACCYVEFTGCQSRKIYQQPVPGRPLRDEQGERVLPPLREGADWIADLGQAAPDAEKARAWLEAARVEHASIAAFARASLELLALGAPPDLLSEVHAAALDELEHARMSFAVAARFGASPHGPGPLPQPPLGPVDVGRLAASAIVDGFANESAAAIDARERAEQEPDPVAREVLLRIAVDEERHAALGLKIAAFALERDPELARAAIVDALESLSGELARDLVIPCVTALLQSRR